MYRTSVHEFLKLSIANTAYLFPAPSHPLTLQLNSTVMWITWRNEYVISCRCPSYQFNNFCSFNSLPLNPYQLFTPRSQVLLIFCWIWFLYNFYVRLRRWRTHISKFFINI